MKNEKSLKDAMEGLDAYELSFEELDAISGGRRFRMPEVRDWGKVYTWYNNTFDRLTTAKDYDTALALRDAYEAAEAQYKADLEASAQDSPDIYFSSYMTEWMQRLGE